LFGVAFNIIPKKKPEWIIVRTKVITFLYLQKGENYFTVAEKTGYGVGRISRILNDDLPIIDPNLHKKVKAKIIFNTHEGRPKWYNTKNNRPRQPKQLPPKQ
jgi:hypothetical protein